MSHRVVVLGAGYAGLLAAGRLARQARRRDLRVTVVNATESFVERPRLHQLGTGQKLKEVPLRQVLEPVGAELVVDTVDSIDLDRRTLRLHGDETGERTLGYDTLIYAAGSTIDRWSVAGVAENAHALTDPWAAGRLASAIGRAERHGKFVVCGGGLTGIETAAELAESHPDLDVTLVSRTEPGAWLSSRAQAHLARAFDRLGVRVRAGQAISGVKPDEVVFEDGGCEPFDECVWTGGFTVPPLASESGLQVNAHGRVVVDRTMRSVSHPDVYAVGDAAAVQGEWGEQLAMGCRTGALMGPRAADVLADRAAGREPKEFHFKYFHECISLGRRDCVIQFLNPDESPKQRVLKGRLAVWYKNVVLDSARWLLSHPGPYLPRR